VTLAPLRRVGETLPFVPSDVVPDQVQRHDRHPDRLHDSVQTPDVVDQRQPLANPRQRLARQVLHGQRRRRGLLAPQGRRQQPVTEASVAVVPEAQGVGHALSLSADQHRRVLALSCPHTDPQRAPRFNHRAIGPLDAGVSS
jgi:hypothetical protein